MSVASVSLADLRSIDLFDDLDDAALEEWLPVARVRTYEPGEMVAEQGEEAPGVGLLLEGTMLVLLVDQGRAERVARQHARASVTAAP